MCRPFKSYLALKASLTTAADDTYSFIYFIHIFFIFRQKKVLTFCINRRLQISFGMLKVKEKMMMFPLFKIYLTLKAPKTFAAEDILFYLSEKNKSDISCE